MTEDAARYESAVDFARHKGLTEPRAHAFARWAALHSRYSIPFLWDHYDEEIED